MAIELTEAQINGRWHVLERPLVAPSKCAVCGAVDRPVMDFGFDLDYYGAVYFCVECYKAGAQLLGLIDVSQLVQSTPNQEIESVVDEYYRASRDLLDDLISRVSVLSLSSGPSDSTEPEDLQGVDRPELSVIADSDTGSSEPVAENSEPVVSEGPAKLPSSSDDGSTGLFLF